VITDSRLLADLHEAKNSKVREYLDQLIEDASEEIDNAPTDRMTNIGIGKRRALKELAKAMDTALDTFEELKKKPKVDMTKAF